MSRHKQPVATVDHAAVIVPTDLESANDNAVSSAPKTSVSGTSAKTAIAPNDYSDLIFGGSFIAAALFGVANVINNIRHSFYESFLKPPSEVLDLKKYSDTEARVLHPFADLFRDRKRMYQTLSREFDEGKITGAEFNEKKFNFTREHDARVSARSQEKFGIATKGLRGWTTDIIKQRNFTGTFARRGAALAMGTTTALGIGAIATMRYSKHLLDRIDENEKQQQDFFSQTQNVVPFNRASNVTHAGRVAPVPAIQVA